jgi:hypothetical protein
MSLAFEAACARCKAVVNEDETALAHSALALPSIQGDNCLGEREGVKAVQGNEKAADEAIAETPVLQEQSLIDEPPPLASAAAVLEEKVLVAGMQGQGKKKKGSASMTAALTVLSKEKKEKKKEKGDAKPAKASNVLIAASVVQKCGIANGAPLVFSAPEHVDVYPRQEPMCEPANARAKMQAWSSDMVTSALTLLYHREPVAAPAHLEKDSLQFEARFDSGNLKRVDRVGKSNMYNLVLRADLGTKGHTQWFYFRTRNMRPGIQYTFKIVNFYKKCSLWSQGLQPLMYALPFLMSRDVI